MSEKKFSSDWKIFRHEKIRFGVVGVVNTLIDFSILNILVFVFGWPVFMSNIMSTTMAMIVSFLLNKNTVFRNTAPGKRQIIPFVVVTLAGLWIVQTCVVVGVYDLLGVTSEEIRLNIAKVIGTVFSLTWNYLWYSRVIFKKRMYNKSSE